MIRHAGVSTVAVIGGGPAGLAAAIALRQEGYSVTVMDHAVPPIDKACGEGLMPDSLAVLAELGVEIPSGAGCPFRGIRFSDTHSSVAADFPNGHGLGIRRPVLHTLLLNRARDLGVVFHWGVKKTDLAALEADLIVGADGQNSHTRRFCGLQQISLERKRYAFRRHYPVAPWSPYVEIYWGQGYQVYLTPVASDEVCLVSMSSHSQVRLEQALAGFPALRDRLGDVPPSSRDAGALSVSRRLRRVCRDNFALIGDASGSVDAITGEGLCLSFKQALSLAAAVKAGELERYQQTHRTLSRVPARMATLMLTLDSGAGFQRRALAALSRCPDLFASLLALHVGARSVSDLFSWRLLELGRAFLEA